MPSTLATIAIISLTVHAGSLKQSPFDPLSFIQTPAARVVFPDAESMDSTMAALIGRVVAAQAPFPAIPRAGEVERLTVSLIGSQEPGKLASAIPYRRIVILPMAELTQWAPERLHRVVRHEVAHVELFEFLAGEPVPRWFDEGYSEWASGPLTCDSEIRIRTAVALLRQGDGGLTRSVNLEGPAGAQGTRIAYDFHWTAIDYIERHWGIGDLLPAIREWGFGEGVLRTTGRSLTALEVGWIEFIRAAYAQPYDGVSCVILDPATGATFPEERVTGVITAARSRS